MDTMKYQKSVSRTVPKTKATSVKLRNVRKVNRNNQKKCICCVNIVPLDIHSLWQELRSDRKLCDGIIKTSDGEEFYIHRIVMSSVSRYFKAFFTNCLKTDKSEIKELVINDVPSCLMRKLIDYAYSGQCSITEENVCKIIPVADQFDCIGLLNLCCTFLLNHLKPENCIGLYKFAQQYFCKDVENKSCRFICYNFTEIYQTSEEFLELTAEELYHILSDDRLHIKSEIITFEAIDRWINIDLTVRKIHYNKLLECVRFGNMQAEYFNNVVRNYPLNDDETKNIMDIADVVISIKEHLFDHVMCRPRIPFEIMFAVGGWSAGHPTNFVETYDTRADQWFLSAHSDQRARAYHGLVLLNNLMYMIGGFDGVEHFNTMRCFDPVARVWSEKACMYHARCYLSVCALNGEIYAMGGFNGYTRMNSVEKYDPVLNQWELIPPMNKIRSDASAASVNGKIYIVGGFNGTEVMRSVEVYDPAVQQWTFVASMEHFRSGVSLVMFRNILYALGGFDSGARLQSGEKYDPDKEFWEPIANMHSPRSNFASVVLDDMIYVIGGFNGTTTVSSAECYDTVHDKWLKVADMNLNRSALAACVCKDLPNARYYSYLSNVEDYQVRSQMSNRGDNGEVGVQEERLSSN